MVNIPTKQAFSRYRALPPSLQNALLSIQTAEVVRQTCEENHLPPEKNPEIAGATGSVLLGYAHTEDLAKEIEERAKISPQAAAAIADTINKKIFAPLRADLDKVYAPLPHEEEIPIAPKIIEEIKMPAKAPEVTTTVKLPPSPLPPVASKPPEAQPRKEIIGEFARLAAEKKPATPSVAPKSEGGEPPPTILHEEPKPVVTPPSVSSFRVNIPPPPKMPGAREMAPPPKPAVTEFGIKTTPPPKPFKPPQDKPPVVSYVEPPRVVNYAGFKTPLDETLGKAVRQASLDTARDKQGKPPEKPKENVPPPPKPQSPIPAKEREIEEITAKAPTVSRPPSAPFRFTPPPPPPSPSQVSPKQNLGWQAAKPPIISQPELPPAENIEKEDAANRSTPQKPTTKPPAPPVPPAPKPPVQNKW